MSETVNLLRVKSLLRSVLMTAKEGIPANKLQNEYKEMVGERIPVEQLGFSSIQNFIKSIPDVAVSKRVNGVLFFVVVPDTATEHIHRLVTKQKSKFKRKKPGKQTPSAPLEERPRRRRKNRSKRPAVEATSSTPLYRPEHLGYDFSRSWDDYMNSLEPWYQRYEDMCPYEAEETRKRRFSALQDDYMYQESYNFPGAVSPYPSNKRRRSVTDGPLYWDGVPIASGRNLTDCEMNSDYVVEEEERVRNHAYMYQESYDFRGEVSPYPSNERMRPDTDDEPLYWDGVPIASRRNLIDYELYSDLVVEKPETARDRLCKLFLGRRGCPKGNTCNCLHVPSNWLSVSDRRNLGFQQEQCREFLNSGCRDGIKCRFLHVSNHCISAIERNKLELPPIENCKFFKRGYCWYGDKCEYLHQREPRRQRASKRRTHVIPSQDDDDVIKIEPQKRTA